MKRVLESLPRVHEGREVPVVLFTKGGGCWIEDLAASGADAIGLDWTVDIGHARRMTKDRVAIQGNMDPAVLMAGEEVIRKEARKVLDSFGPVEKGGHVFNLGHGVDLSTPVEAVEALVDEVHAYSPHFH